MSGGKLIGIDSNLVDKDDPGETIAFPPELFERIKRNGLSVRCVEHLAGCKWEGSLSQLVDHAAQECDFYFVPCPNSCVEKKIVLKCLEEHRRSECPLEAIQCKYADVGCPYQGNRKDMDIHEKKATASHLELVEKDRQRLLLLQTAGSAEVKSEMSPLAPTSLQMLARCTPKTTHVSPPQRTLPDTNKPMRVCDIDATPCQDVHFCRMKYRRADSPVTQCTKCLNWFHLSCVKAFHSRRTAFVCPMCQ